jgi:hypothetical protein
MPVCFPPMVFSLISRDLIALVVPAKAGTQYAAARVGVC